jgi:hypothetical protein
MAVSLIQSLARCWAVGGSLAVAPCFAQPADVDPFHWAYAPALGSNVYRLTDGTETQTYRANTSFKVREAERNKAGIRVLLPFAFGVENLDDDIRPLEQGADQIEHVGFLPGVELEHRVGERWTLRTRAQLGYAKELEGGEDAALLAAAGLRSRVEFAAAPGSPALINGLLWTGFDASNGDRHSLLRFTTGLEFDVRAARWEFRDSPMRWRPHVLKDWYYRPPPALAFGDEDARLLDEEWQIGVAAEREDGFKIWFFEFDAVGVAYRFSENGEGLRFYLNSIF